MDRIELNEIEKSFSNNQKKLFVKINSLVGRDAAIALISLQGVESTSQTEIEVIANLIYQFEPIKIIDFQYIPRNIILSGKGPKGHSVRIIPQYKVQNINPKAQPWAIDLVIELHRFIGNNLVKIASLGIEYDGYPSHYIESNIKKTYQRDIGIVQENGIQSLRISPESWKKDSSDIKKAIKKFFEHQIKVIEQVQASTINEVNATRLSSSANQPLVKCPICNGEGVLAADYCQVCKGIGLITQLHAGSIDNSEYQQFTCPDCLGNRPTCSKCCNTGIISREKALEWAKKNRV